MKALSRSRQITDRSAGGTLHSLHSCAAVGLTPTHVVVPAAAVLADIIRINRAFPPDILTAGSGPTMTTTLMTTIGLSTSQVLGTIGSPSTSTVGTNFREKRDVSFGTGHRDR
jgi:hypothetical protein